jgi:hypothetical protein
VRDQVEVVEVQRLLVALIALVYDLLTLAELPLTAPDAPYRETVFKSAAELLTRDTNEPDLDQ